MKIRSSGWKTDAIVVVPEALLLSYAWIVFSQNNSFFKPYLFTGGITLAVGMGMLLCAGAWRAWKRQPGAEEVQEEAEKMRQLRVNEDLVQQAMKDHMAEEKIWEEMVAENMGTSSHPTSSLPKNMASVFVLSVAGVLLPLLPFLVYPAASWEMHVFTGLLLAVAGAWKFSATGRNPLEGSLRLLLNGVLQYLLIKGLFYLTSS